MLLDEKHRTKWHLTFLSLVLVLLFLLGMRLEVKNAESRLKLQGLILKAIKAADVECCVSVDREGVIDWCNSRFVRQFGVGVGSKLESIMPEQTRIRHFTASVTAISKHHTSPTEFQSRNCVAIDRKGRPIPVEVSAWTTETGAIGFITIPQQMRGTKPNPLGEWQIAVEKAIQRLDPDAGFPSTSDSEEE